jgi:1,4-alpha-glucan branching enzyme
MSDNTKKDVGAILHKTGATFRVWAPFAHSVAVTGSFNDWSQTPLHFEGDGYWAITLKGVHAGQEYKYVISDGHRQLYKNDPRALQVTTIAGNSVVVDPSFEWGDEHFEPLPFNQQVVYEMHIGTFNRTDPATAGTFQNATEKLDYLADLGVTTIEVMPVASMSMNREWWGYTPEYIYAVEGLYGGRYQFLEFIKAAHAHGISVILDVVYNHMGPDGDHGDQATSDLWQFDGWSQDGKGGIYFYNDWRFKTPWSDARFDFGRPEVRQYILDNVRMWLHDFHLDGLRVDSTSFIRNAKGNNDDPSTDLPEGWALLQHINDISKEISDNALVIAEDIDYNDYLTKATADGGAGFSAQWGVNFPRALRWALDATDDAKRNLNEITNQIGRRYNGDAFQRVVYSDSHDSAAIGHGRLNEEVSPGNPASMFARKRSLLAASIVLTTPGIPMLLQGQEFMQGGSFSDWQELDWEKVEQYAGIVLAYKHLIALRRNKYDNTRGLIGQSLNILHLDTEGDVLAYHRWDKGGPNDDVVIVINFTNRVLNDYSIPLPRNGTWRARFNSDWKGYSPDFKGIEMTDVTAENNTAALHIGPYSVVILSQDS